MKFHSAWQAANISPAEQDKCRQWLLGAGPAESVAVATECIQVELQGQTVNKYRTTTTTTTTTATAVVAESAISSEEAMETS